MSNKETKIQKETLLESGKIPSLRLFRNNVGVGFQGKILNENYPIITLENYRRVSFGLMPGSGDCIGWQSIKITTDMVGKSIAQFVSVELKTDIGKPQTNQKNWYNQVTNSGGKAVIIRDPESLTKAFL